MRTSLTVPRRSRRVDVLPYYIPSRASAQGGVGCIWPYRRQPRRWAKTDAFRRV